VALCGAIVLGNEVYYAVALKSHGLAVSEQRLLARVARIRVLILGDSQPAMAFGTQWIDGSFRLTSGGESYVQTYYRLRDALAAGVSPEAIVLPCDFQTFSAGKLAHLGLDVWYWRRHVDYWEVVRNNGDLSLWRSVLAGSIYFLGAGTSHRVGAGDRESRRRHAVDWRYRRFSEVPASDRLAEAAHALRGSRRGRGTPPWFATSR